MSLTYPIVSVLPSLNSLSEGTEQSIASSGLMSSLTGSCGGIGGNAAHDVFVASSGMEGSGLQACALR